MKGVERTQRGPREDPEKTQRGGREGGVLGSIFSKRGRAIFEMGLSTAYGGYLGDKTGLQPLMQSGRNGRFCKSIFWRNGLQYNVL